MLSGGNSLRRRSDPNQEAKGAWKLEPQDLHHEVLALTRGEETIIQHHYPDPEARAGPTRNIRTINPPERSHESQLLLSF